MDLDQDQDLPDPDGRGGGTSQAFGPAELMAAIASRSAGKVLARYDERLVPELLALRDQLVRAKVTVPTLEATGEYVAAGGLAYLDGPVGAKWLVQAGNLVELVARAEQWVREGRPNFNGKASTPAQDGLSGGKTGRKEGEEAGSPTSFQAELERMRGGAA